MKSSGCRTAPTRGELASHTYPDCTTSTLCGSSAARTQGYGYTRGRLTSVTGYANSIAYHPNGLIDTIVRANGVTDRQTADASGMARPAEISAVRTSDSLGLWTTGAYKYDGSGNVWKTGSGVYLYDSLSRVVSGKVYPGAMGAGTPSTQTYGYDTYGNLTSTTTNGTLVNTPAATTTNRLTAGTYDASGNLTSWSGNTYEYDAFDQMSRHVSSGEDWRYMYTADDERFWAFRAGGGGSTWTLRGLGGEALREYSAHLGWRNYRDNIYRGGTLLATVASAAAGGTTKHLHTDHLGTPRLITDGAGNPATAQFHAYYPYGEELAATYTTAYTEKMRFTGHERDLVNLGGQGDDLDYMHARHYGVVTGRFLSVDPAANSADSLLPQTWNRYVYALGNPLKWVDPDGQAWKPAPGMSPAEIDFARAMMSDPGIGPSPMGMVGPRSVVSAADDAAVGGIRYIAKKLLNIFAENLDKATVEAAAREAAGEVVALKASGEAFDHVIKYNTAREGAVKLLGKLTSAASDMRLSPEQRATALRMMKEVSRKLDQLEKLYKKEAILIGTR